MSLKIHEITGPDAQAMEGVRAALAAIPKLTFEPGAREVYDQIIGQVPPPQNVRFEQAEVGGVPGWWAYPEGAESRSAILYLHGGGYVIGSAGAYRNFVGHITKKAGAVAFIADYALAPERPFPCAPDDVKAAHGGLMALGYERIAFCGDSAGGGLLLSYLTGHDVEAGRIVAAAAMSPWIDLSLSSESMFTRAVEDPILSKNMLADAADLYLAGRALGELGAATLEVDLSKLPPVRIDVGDAEVLRDDSVRFANQAEASGLNAEVHVWQGMVHVFPSNFPMLQASASALEDIARFLAVHLGTQAEARA